MEFVQESFSPAEQAILRGYFTNVDGPIFGLINLPEVVKAALFARYSRTSKSLRRLFLDEFYEDLGLDGEAPGSHTVGVTRAERLFARVISDYGDDSVAQLGGVHVACEQASNVLTKVLERGRLLSYLEQSTRYLDYGTKNQHGHYRYQVPPEIDGHPGLHERYVTEMDQLFDTYNTIREQVLRYLVRDNLSSEELRAAKAASYDATRGLLPAGTLSNLGVFGSPQGFEGLVMRLRASPYAEARLYGERLRDELMTMVPSFLTRLDRQDRGIAWVEYLQESRVSTQGYINDLLGEVPPAVSGDEVQLLSFDHQGEDRILEGILFEYSGLSGTQAELVVRKMSDAERGELIRRYVGDRRNRRHKPGRAFESCRYNFEIVSDYGAFRDLQRHRLLTVEWQPLGVELGFDTPALISEAGCTSEFSQAMGRAQAFVRELQNTDVQLTPYGTPMGFRIRYRLELNAREAMHLIELRSQASGHPSYRRVAQQMHQQIRNIAGHNLVAIAMSYLDEDDYTTGRVDAERQAENRRASLT